MSNVQPVQPNRKLRPHAVQQFGFGCNLHDIVVDAGTTPQDLMNPAYWEWTVNKIRKDDWLFVRVADGAWRMMMAVTAAYEHGLAVEPLMVVDLADKTPVPKESAFEVSWGSQHQKWRVIRKSDRQIMQQDIETKADAIELLKRIEREYTVQAA